MRHHWGLGVVLAVGLLAPATAFAQTAPPYDPAIDVQMFEYAIGPKTFFTVSDADVAEKKQLTVDAVVTFLTNPFTVYTVTGPKHDMIDPNARSRVVESMAAAQITAAYGMTDKIQLGVNLPIVFSMSGKGLDPTTGMADPNGLQVTGLGDLLAEGKLRLYKEGSLRVGGIAGLSLPTSFGSDGSKFLGDDLPTLRARIAAQWDRGPLSVGANLGFILRKPRTIYSSTIGPQTMWAVAASYKVIDRLALIAESFGRTGIISYHLDESPIEVIGGLRLYAAGSVAVVVGGGVGLDRAIGSPDKVFFASVGYAPDVRDSDGDGIANNRDKCPLVPEDKDGWEDDDGCPDDDNDGDHRPDADDKCPNQAEDLDGFDDDDGCPELDNDKDGILDLADKCPNDAEDGKQPYPKDGCPGDKRDSDGDGIPDSADSCPMEEEDSDSFEDGDGCPELDNDNDGVPDAQDKCPVCPEDKDGFEDDDGCPELDNDHDGIVDAKDQCPLEPETVNGVKDDDGCPDTGAVNVTLDGDRMSVAKMPKSATDSIVEQMALVMLGHSEVTQWLLAVGAPNQKVAQQLGDAIKARLEKRGVTGVDVLAAKGPAKIGALVKERGDANAPACPAGREVKPRPETITPKALMPDAKTSSAPTVAPQPKPQPKPEPKPDDAKKPDGDGDIDMGN